jgi:hypothetical protein
VELFLQTTIESVFLSFSTAYANMKFEKSCIEERATLQTCLASANMLTKLLGDCQLLEDKYHRCMDSQIDKQRKESLESSKERMKKWQENNRKYNL